MSAPPRVTHHPRKGDASTRLLKEILTFAKRPSVQEVDRRVLLADLPGFVDRGLAGRPAAFRLGRIEDAARKIPVGDYYEGLALSRATDVIAQARRDMAVSALMRFGKESDPAQAWFDSSGERLNETRKRMSAIVESGELSVSRLAVASGLMADLSAL